MTTIKFRSVLLLSFYFITQILIAQTPYQNGWKALDDADLGDAIEFFEKAVEKDTDREQALVMLTLVYERINRNEKATKAFRKFHKSAKDPYPEIYALWFDEALVGESSGKRDKQQLAFLKSMKDDPRNVGKLDMAVNYRLGLHEVFSFDHKSAQKHFDQINNIRDWAFVGPFDNVMNSGFNKDFGVLGQPENNATFKSKYGAEVSWFDPPLSQSDGYSFKGTHFTSSNSIVYAQTFLNVDQAQEVFLKLGYSGSLKLWINDELIYSESEKRKTELDYFNFKGKLNKGYNRILVQLGDFSTSWANFSMRFTDLNHKALTFPNVNKKQTYVKGQTKFERIPHFAVASLEAKAKQNPDDALYNILLAEAYMRSNELDKAESALQDLYKKAPKNYFGLLNLILLYDKANNETEQNRFYELFKKHYPKDRDLLANDISKFSEEKNKSKTKELIDEYLQRYRTSLTEVSYGLVMDNMNEDYEAAINKINSMYKDYPENFRTVIAKYQVEKSLQTNPAAANRVLEKFLQDNFNASILEELAKNYLEDGKVNKAVKLLEKSIEIADYDLDTYNKIIGIYSRKSQYDKAIKLGNKIIINRPSDYNALSDLGLMHKMEGNTKEAIKYYEQALSYFPFVAETNDKIRELKGKKVTDDIIKASDPQKIIADYEKNFSTDIKKPYDIVLDKKSVIVFNSKATSNVQEYILRINDESAIQDWQRWNLGSTANMSTTINEAKTIKANGNTIDAERYGTEVVFTKLEVGDYIYAYVTEKQVRGGKSAFFISDSYSLNSYYPIFKKSYTVLAEDEIKIDFKTLNTNQQPVISEKEGFKTYSWEIENATLLKEEDFSPAFSDIAQSVHMTLDYTWYDIAQWYSDLSSNQAKPDFTINNIVKELFDGKNYTNKEKAKVIYDFVCKNIQYSSIDFRQSSHIPQKASDVYHSRLGDCKDISTLYASIAREVGLNTNLVLINTRNNGQKDILLPSLNFNHCIVKVNFEEESHFLELTDPNLPYGNLYWYHDGAAILEIPNGEIPRDISLDYLPLNKGFNSSTTRTSTAVIDASEKLSITTQTNHTGVKAAVLCDSYYNEDEQKRKEKMKKAIASSFTSNINLENLEFKVLEPRSNVVNYDYAYSVNDEVLKVGSFRSLKIPFADFLLGKSILEKEEERTHLFNFKYYENRDIYEQTIDMKLESPFSYMEVPEDVHLEFQDFVYDLKFTKVSDQHITVKRTYKPSRDNIKAKDFAEFKGFVKEVIEAEKTNVVFK